MESKEVAELSPTPQILFERAAHALERRIAGRSHGRQAVGRAALDDEDEALRRVRVCEGHARQAEAGNGRGPSGQKEAAGEHPHLLTNSGLTNSKARPSVGLSER